MRCGRKSSFCQGQLFQATRTGVQAPWKRKHRPTRTHLSADLGGSHLFDWQQQHARQLMGALLGAPVLASPILVCARVLWSDVSSPHSVPITNEGSICHGKGKEAGQQMHCVARFHERLRTRNGLCGHSSLAATVLAKTSNRSHRVFCYKNLSSRIVRSTISIPTWLGFGKNFVQVGLAWLQLRRNVNTEVRSIRVVAARAIIPAQWRTPRLAGSWQHQSEWIVPTAFALGEQTACTTQNQTSGCGTWMVLEVPPSSFSVRLSQGVHRTRL